MVRTGCRIVAVESDDVPGDGPDGEGGAGWRSGEEGDGDDRSRDRGDPRRALKAKGQVAAHPHGKIRVSLMEG
jgi:hypothetical protein